jgi:hypothetical protein
MSTDLSALLEMSHCECFNADDAHPLRNALAEECRDDPNLVLNSDVDEGALTHDFVARLRRMLKPRADPVRVQSCWSSYASASWSGCPPLQ